MVPLEEMYDVLLEVHTNLGHRGRDAMLKEVSNKYANITRQVIELFLKNCHQCILNQRRKATTGIVVKPILSQEFNDRAQVDLIDMQSMSDDGYKWILVYQDHFTKFCILKALKQKTGSQVASQLFEIFTTFGVPLILQSDIGAEFRNQVVEGVKALWPGIHLVHGRPRHPQSQGSVERANGDIKKMLVAWMRENASKRWTIGIKFVQFQKNKGKHAGE